MSDWTRAPAQRSSRCWRTTKILDIFWSGIIMRPIQRALPQTTLCGSFRGASAIAIAAEWHEIYRRVDSGWRRAADSNRHLYRPQFRVRSGNSVAEESLVYPDTQRRNRSRLRRTKHANLIFSAAEYHQLELFDEAAAVMEEIVRLRPKDARAHFFLGTYHFLYQHDGVCGARADFERALTTQAGLCRSGVFSRKH